jgi:hypothetical protein
MGRIAPRTTRARLHAAAGLALVVALLAGFFTFAGPAFAHHPSIEGWSDCDESGHVVDFTSESWSDETSWGGGNPRIEVAYRVQVPNAAPGAWIVLPWHASYRFDESNDFQFDGVIKLTESQADGTVVQLRAQAGAPWSNGTVNTEPRYSAWIELQADCDCDKPTTTTTTSAPTTTTTAPTTTTTAPTTTTTKASTTTTTSTTTTAPTTTSTVVVSPTTELATTTTTTPSTTAPTTTAPRAAVLGVQESRAAVLPVTGSSALGLVAFGGAVLCAGVFLVRAARLRNED